LRCVRGCIRIDIASGSWIIPPMRLAFIPAGTPARATGTEGATCERVLVTPEAFVSGERVTAFAAPSVLQEMITYARRWSAHSALSDPDAEPVLRALACLANRAMARETPNFIPSGCSGSVRTGLLETRRRHSDPSLVFADIAACSKRSPRTLSRRILAETGLTWGEILRRIRMAEAVSTMIAGERSVQAVAHSVGYGSMSAFTIAFRSFAGVNPSRFRRLAR
ncbi:MAG: helix-turn-helix domain-containing protein, partial [Rubricella sp.]